MWPKSYYLLVIRIQLQSRFKVNISINNTLGILRLPDVPNDIRFAHQKLIKDAQELSSLIYGKLANEAYENAMKQQPNLNEGEANT